MVRLCRVDGGIRLLSVLVLASGWSSASRAESAGDLGSRLQDATIMQVCPKNNKQYSQIEAAEYCAHKAGHGSTEQCYTEVVRVDQIIMRYNIFVNSCNNHN
jgi:hypothetical protein